MTNEKTIKQTILHLTGKQSYKGFNYVVYGIALSIEDSEQLKYISKSLYIDIASKFNTSQKNVERNVRTVIDVIWRNKNNELLKKICNGKVSSKPTNKNFFIMMSEYFIYLDDCDEIAAGMDSNFDNELKAIKEYFDPLYNNLIDKINELIAMHKD